MLAESTRKEYTELEVPSTNPKVKLSMQQINSEENRINQEIINDKRQLESESSTILFDLMSNGFGDSEPTYRILAEIC